MPKVVCIRKVIKILSVTLNTVFMTIVMASYRVRTIIFFNLWPIIMLMLSIYQIVSLLRLIKANGSYIHA